MSATKCLECGGVTQLRTHVHTSTVGTLKVKDGSCQLHVCEQCGNVDLTLADLRAYERRAAVTVLRTVSEVTGTMLKYARKSLGLTQSQLAVVLATTPETISRYENEHFPSSRQHALALLALLDIVIQRGVDPKELAASLSRNDGAAEIEVCNDEAA